MLTESTILSIVDSDGRPSILRYLNDPTNRDRFGWNDYTWHAVARLRYCHAYCSGRIYDALKNRTHTDQGLIPGDVLHTPGCAYATDNWISHAINLIGEVNSR